MADDGATGTVFPCDVCGVEVPSVVDSADVGMRPVVRCQACARRLHIIRLLDACDRMVDMPEWAQRSVAVLRTRYDEAGCLSDVELTNLEAAHRTVVQIRSGDPPPRLSPREQRTLMLRLGGHVRRTREFLGLTQTDLATLAGTSQATVSRLEQGRAVGTPYLIVLSVQQALCTRLHELSLSLPDAASRSAHPAMLDGVDSPAPYLDVLVSFYRRAPSDIRRHLLDIVELLTPA